MNKLFIGILAIMFVLGFAMDVRADTDYIEAPSGYLSGPIDSAGAVVSATPVGGVDYVKYRLRWDTDNSWAYVEAWPEWSSNAAEYNEWLVILDLDIPGADEVTFDPYLLVASLLDDDPTAAYGGSGDDFEFLIGVGKGQQIPDAQWLPIGTLEGIPQSLVGEEVATTTAGINLIDVQEGTNGGIIITHTSPEPASMVMLGLALLGTAVKKFTS